MLSITEIKGSEGSYNPSNNTRVRKFLVPFGYQGNPYDDPAVPKQGDSHPTDAFLYCLSANDSEEANGNKILTFNYSSDGKLSEDFYEYSANFSAEMIDTTRGMKWKTTGTTVDIPITTIMPVVTEEISVRSITSPRKVLRSAVGKVNDRIFHGAEPGQLLLEGASVSIRRNRSGAIVSANTSFRFLYREQPHNDVFRVARQKKDPDTGLWLTYSDKPGAQYPADETHLDGDPVCVDGSAGESAWDTPYYVEDGVEKYRYAAIDFATVLGLPIEDGDDAPGEQS